MKKLFLFLTVLLFIVACKNEEDVPVVVKISHYDISGGWICESLEAHLIGAGAEIDNDINNRLNGYTPHLNLSFTATNCYFYFVVNGSISQPVKIYSYDIKHDKDIIFDIDDVEISTIESDKLRAIGYIKDGKLCLTFSRIDFEIFTWVLGDDYPFNKAMIADTKAGEVTLVFESLK